MWNPYVVVHLTVFFFRLYLCRTRHNCINVDADVPTRSSNKSKWALPEFSGRAFFCPKKTIGRGKSCVMVIFPAVMTQLA